MHSPQSLHCARRVGSSRCAFRIQRDVHVRILLSSQVAQCIASLWVLCRTLTTVGTRLIVSAWPHVSRTHTFLTLWADQPRRRLRLYCAVVGIAWIWMMASDYGLIRLAIRWRERQRGDESVLDTERGDCEMQTSLYLQAGPFPSNARMYMCMYCTGFE